MMVALILEWMVYAVVVTVLFFIVRMVLKAYLGNEMLKREAAAKNANREILLPLRLQAYERLILLLERISPQQAVTRNLAAGIPALQFQIILVQNIREEFEHNTAQQVYVSSHSWALVRSAKEEVIRLINSVSAEMDSKNTAAELAQRIIEKASEWEKNPVQAAMEQLKGEVTALY